MPQELTIQVVRNYTVEPIGEALHEAAQKIGVSVKTEFGAYDNLGVEIASLAAAPTPPSIVLVTIDLDYFAGGIHSPKWDLAETVNELNSILDAIDAISAKSFVLISNFI